MTLVLKDIRKVAVLGWTHDPEGSSDWVIKGEEATIKVKLADGTEQEKRVVKNDGEADIFFPHDYTGSVDVIIEGTESGRDESTLHVR